MISGFEISDKHERFATATMVLLTAVLVFGNSAYAAPPEFGSTAFASYKPDLKNGQYMFNAAGCAACHGSAVDPKLLSGGLEMRSAIGTFKVPNITASAKGIGGWSNATFLNAVMIGVKRDGTNLYPVMPYTAYAGMKPEDVLDIKAYIETLSPSDASSGAHEISFPYNQQFAVSLWKRANFSTRPFQPAANSQLERGRTSSKTSRVARNVILVAPLLSALMIARLMLARRGSLVTTRRPLGRPTWRRWRRQAPL